LSDDTISTFIHYLKMPIQNKSKQILWHVGRVTVADREQLFLQTPLTIWLTGLSASGKSTLAYALESDLITSGHACYVLDGDNVRHGLNNNLGFSEADRAENIRRIAEVAKLFNDAGLIVIAAFISPATTDREVARGIIGDRFFREVHVSTSLHVCEERDPKGLYVKARRGEVANFTGISAPHEIPVNADLVIDTATMSIEHAIGLLKSLIRS
jgi:adenylyl-sulfate kinase